MHFSKGIYNIFKAYILSVDVFPEIQTHELALLAACCAVRATGTLTIATHGHDMVS